MKMVEPPLSKVSSGPWEGILLGWEAEIHLEKLALSEYSEFLSMYVKDRQTIRVESLCSITVLHWGHSEVAMFLSSGSECPLTTFLLCMASSASVRSLQNQTASLHIPELAT